MVLDDVVNELLPSPDPAQTIWTAEKAVGAVTLVQVVTKLRCTAGGEAAAGLHALEQFPQLCRLQHLAVGFWCLVICRIRIGNTNLSTELVLIFLRNIEGFDINLICVERNQSWWHLLSFI